MQIGDFIGIAVIGAILSAVIEVIQRRFGTSSGKTKALTIVLSIVVGGAYFLLRNTAWWATIIGILAASSTVYALFIPKGSTAPASPDAQ